jgi:hypothetical protein
MARAPANFQRYMITDRAQNPCSFSNVCYHYKRKTEVWCVFASTPTFFLAVFIYRIEFNLAVEPQDLGCLRSSQLRPRRLRLAIRG